MMKKKMEVKKVKVMVKKEKMVDGKKMVKMVELNLDPKEMTYYTTPTTVKKKVLEMVADTRVFAPDELKELKFDMKEFMKEWRSDLRKKEEERQKKMEKVMNTI
jgi:hypothetical protein